MNLVRAYGHHIHMCSGRINAEFTESLYRVHMKQRLRIHTFNQFTRLRNRLYASDFIVRMHD